MALRLTLSILAISLLAGCLHAQLGGSIAGATISVTELRDPGTVVDTTVTADEDFNIALYGEEAWAGFNALVRHWLFGVFYVNGEVIDPDRLYLVTASGGVETDLDRDLLADDDPVPVAHPWRAILTGAQLLEVGFKVSALTEAAYRWLAADIENLDDAALRARLDIAGAALVNDVDRDGRVDGSDLAGWTRLLSPQDSFLGDFDALNALSEALVLGASETELQQLAEIVMAPAEAGAYWHQLVSDIDDEIYATADFLYDEQPDPDFCVAGSLSQAAKDRQLEAVNRIRALHGLAAVVYSSAFDRGAQEGALIQHANDYLNHFPAPGDACFTEAGAESAGSGNLTGGSAIKDPAEDMIGHVDDSRNVGQVAAAGHRRSTLNPFLAYTAYGQVEGSSVQKVFGFDGEPDLVPRIDVDYVAFPYGVYPFLFLSTDPGRPTPWSFSVIEDKTDRWANQHDYFSGATVSVTRLSDGEQLTVTDQYSDTDGFGVPNFLSWQVPDWAYDTRYRVDIADVAMASGGSRDFSYEVFINYAALVDLNEPLEGTDRISGDGIAGELTSQADRDSFEVELAGTVRFTGDSQYNNLGFYILLYGPDKQLVNGEDDSFTITLDEGLYTVVLSACHENVCYRVEEPTVYTVDIDRLQE